MINVLFVCLGNICRSPMAEAIFTDLVEQEGLSDQFYIDSVGTGNYHIGDRAHHGTLRVLAGNGIKCTSVARQINQTDLSQSDYVIAMDQHNLSDLHDMVQTNSVKGQFHLLLNFAPDTRLRDVPDPYYTGNFEEVFRLVHEGCRGLLTDIRQERGI